MLTPSFCPAPPPSPPGAARRALRRRRSQVQGCAKRGCAKRGWAKRGWAKRGWAKRGCAKRGCGKLVGRLTIAAVPTPPHTWMIGGRRRRPLGRRPAHEAMSEEKLGLR